MRPIKKQLLAYAIATVCVLAAIRPASALDRTRVRYNGGPILQPEIVTLYWGSFNQSDINTMQAYLQGLATFMSSPFLSEEFNPTTVAQFEPTVAQYGVRGATVGMTRTVAGSGHTTQSQVAFEIRSLQSQGLLWGYSPNRLFLVFTNGIVVDDLGACALHDVDAGVSSGQYYAIVPFPSASNYAAGSQTCAGNTDVWQTYTSHEIFEAATDPNPWVGWSSIGLPGGTVNGEVQEIADFCQPGVGVPGVAETFGFVTPVLDESEGTSDSVNCNIATKRQYAPLTSVQQPASTGVAQVDVFALMSDFSIAHAQATTSTFVFGPTKVWENLGSPANGFGAGSAPAVVAGAAGAKTLDVFVQGVDNHLYHKSFNGSSWTTTSWDALGGTFAGPPAVASSGPNHIDIFVLGTDGAIWHASWAGGPWSSVINTWQSIGAPQNSGAPGSGMVYGPPAAISLGTNSLQVFARGSDGIYGGQYFENVWNGSSWRGWDASAFRGDVYISEPVVITNAPYSNTRVDVFGQGTDYAYYHRSQVVGSGFGGLDTSIGGAWHSPPAAAYFNANDIVLVGEGTDGAYYFEESSSHAPFSPYQGLSGGVGIGSATLAATPETSPNSTWAFVQGTDGTVWESTLSGNRQWNGWHSWGD